MHTAYLNQATGGQASLNWFIFRPETLKHCPMPFSRNYDAVKTGIFVYGQQINVLCTLSCLFHLLLLMFSIVAYVTNAYGNKGRI